MAVKTGPRRLHSKGLCRQWETQPWPEKEASVSDTILGASRLVLRVGAVETKGIFREQGEAVRSDSSGLPLVQAEETRRSEH